MLGSINGEGTDGGGKLRNKTARPERQEENVRECETPKQRCYKSERSEYHIWTRFTKSSNPDVSRGWDKHRFCGVVVRETT